MNDDHKAGLEAWGNEPTPTPDPAFADRLEADLRSAAYFAQSQATAKSPRLVRPALVLAAILAVAGTAFAGLNTLNEQDATAPAQTPEIEPTPSPTAAPTATPTPTPLPPDAIDVTPPSAIVPVPTGSPQAAPSPATQTTPAPPTPRSQPPATPTPLPEAPTPLGPEAQPTATPTPRATPTAEPTQTPVADPAITSVTLVRRYLPDERARLSWAAHPSDNIVGWQLVARRGESERIVERFGARRTNVIVDRPTLVRVSYRIVATAADGSVVGESNEVRVAATS